jgi:hypothetical protein
MTTPLTVPELLARLAPPPLEPGFALEDAGVLLAQSNIQAHLLATLPQLTDADLAAVLRCAHVSFVRLREAAHAEALARWLTRASGQTAPL